MSSRGAYRSVYSALADDPDFQRLTPFARLVLYTARLCREAGPSAIFRYYPGTLMAQSGLTAKQMDAALVELQAGRWIEYDASVLWVRNGLRYDPAMTLANPNHRRAIEKHLEELPRSPIVLKFCDYYQIANPLATHPPSHPDPIPDQGKGTGIGKGNREPEREPEKQPPPARAVASLNGHVWDGYREAYERRYGTPPVRNAKVNSQLKLFGQRVPEAEAADIAAFYVEHNGALYVRSGHSVDLLLRDAEKLHTEWVTGHRITETGARQSDQRQERGSIAHRLLDKAERQRRQGELDAQS